MLLSKQKSQDILLHIKLWKLHIIKLDIIINTKYIIKLDIIDWNNYFRSVKPLIYILISKTNCDNQQGKM